MCLVFSSINQTSLQLQVYHYIIQVWDLGWKGSNLKGALQYVQLGHDHEMILKCTKLKEIVVKSFNTY